MAEPQNLVLNLSEMMAKYAVCEAEVHLEPQIEITPMAELERQEEEQNPTQKGRKQKRAEQSRVKQAEESEDDKAFI